MSIPSPDVVSAYLDDLAAITAARGLMLDAYKCRLGPLPAGASPFGGYAALRCGGDLDGRYWWEVHPYQARSVLDPAPVVDDRRAASMDVARLTEHQRLELVAALQRIRDILRSGA
jgi:hypothetical protein